MRTHFRQKSRKEKKGLLAGVSASALLILLFVVLFGKLQSPMLTLIKPALAVRQEIIEKIGNTSKNLLMSREELVEENAKLSAEIERLENRMAVLPYLEKELAFYNELYGRGQAPEKIVGKVISKPPFSPHDYLLLDIGSKQGVRQNAFVENVAGNLLGKVASVEEEHSFVALFSSPNHRVPVILPSGKEVELTGLGSGNFYLELPKDAPLKRNDVLLESSTQKPLAVVSTIISSDSDPFKQLYLRSAVNINTLINVLISK